MLTIRPLIDALVGFRAAAGRPPADTLLAAAGDLDGCAGRLGVKRGILQHVVETSHFQPEGHIWKGNIFKAQACQRVCAQDATHQVRAPACPAGGMRHTLWWGPQFRPQDAQGTYVIVLPVSTITANCLGGVPRCKVA